MKNTAKSLRRSAMAKFIMQTPEVKEKHRQSIVKRQSDPAFHDKRNSALQEKYKDPIWKENIQKGADKYGYILLPDFYADFEREDGARCARDVAKEIEKLKNSTFSNNADKVETEINNLEKEFGKELVAKYREDIKSSALKYPNQKVNKLLYHFAEESEIEDAITKRSENKRKNELEPLKTYLKMLFDLK
jgi:hypothetical protein